MAFGQIDPARLYGDALTRWYLRSPADIEQERQAAAAARYDAFFGGSGEREQAGDEPASSNDGSFTYAVDNSGPPNEPRNSGQDRQFISPFSPPDASPPDGGAWRGYQLAAAPSRTLGDYWSIPGCANCHGYSPATLPPVGGHFPFPPSYSPRSGGSNGSGGRPPSAHEGESSGDHPPQCAIQHNNDSNICRELPDWRVRKQCWASAAEREGYCIKSKGQVGIPWLITR